MTNLLTPCWLTGGSSGIFKDRAKGKPRFSPINDQGFGVFIGRGYRWSGAKANNHESGSDEGTSHAIISPRCDPAKN